MLAKFRNLTRHLHQSTSDAEIFKGLQASTTPLTLIMDVVTRFDSTYLMAQRCLRLEDTVRLYLSKHPLNGNICLRDGKVSVSSTKYGLSINP